MVHKLVFLILDNVQIEHKHPVTTQRPALTSDLSCVCLNATQRSWNSSVAVKDAKFPSDALKKSVGSCMEQAQPLDSDDARAVVVG